jgi:hypothetical protein
VGVDGFVGPRTDHRALNEAEAAGDPETVCWRAIEAFLDVHLRHRDTLLMLVRDMTLLVQAPVADRFKAAIALANTLVSGPRPGLARRLPRHRIPQSQNTMTFCDDLVLRPSPRGRRLRTGAVWRSLRTLPRIARVLDADGQLIEHLRDEPFRFSRHRSHPTLPLVR